jgi:subtilisin family serine protease
VLQEANIGARSFERIHSIKPVVNKFRKTSKLEKDSDGWYWYFGKQYEEVEEIPDEAIFQDAYRQMNPQEKGLYCTYETILPEDMSVEQAIAILERHPGVEYAEPNYIYHICDTLLPDTPYIPDDHYIKDGINWREGSWSQEYPDMWGLKNIQAIEAYNLFDTNGNGIFDDELKPGEGIVVAVVDTGVDYNHADLADNIWQNEAEVNGTPGVDDDGNGFADDYYGYDFNNGDGNPMDDCYHGTHVAGTIAAVVNNGEGIAGVAPYAKIMAVKGLNNIGNGASSNLAKAIRYATDNGAHVVNNSWGGVGISKTVLDAVRYSHARGCVVIAAAGNYNTDIHRLFTPASFKEVITVAATDQNDERSAFSNYGIKVDVAAPGGCSRPWERKEDPLAKDSSYYQTSWEGNYCIIRNDGDPMSWPVENVTLITATGPDQGIADIYVDEVFKKSINLYSPKTVWGVEIPLADVLPQHDFIRIILSSASADKDLIVDDIIFDMPDLGVPVPMPPSYLFYQLDIIFGENPAHQIDSNVLSLLSDNNGRPLTADYYPTLNVGEHYYRLRGTSMASPHVAGLAALILSKHPEFTNEEVRQAIRVSSHDLGETGFDRYHGYGRINAYDALRMDSVCTALVTSPECYSFAWGDVDIIGTASGDNFLSYKVEYGEGENPADFVTIFESSNPVTDDVLFSWDTRSSPPGAYIIRLTVEDTLGYQYEDKLFLRINDLNNGWVYESFNTFNPFFPSNFGDLDGDGNMEIVTLTYSGHMYVFDHKGNILDGWPRYTGSNGTHTPPALGDVNNDGKSEIFLHTPWGIRGFDCLGRSLPGWESWRVVPRAFDTPVLADLNQDGYLDIIGRSGALIYAWDYSGSLFEDFPIDVGGGGPKIAVGDIDPENDGLEIAVPIKAGTNSKIKVYDIHGIEVFSSDVNGNLNLSMGDVNNDGFLEVVYITRSRVGVLDKDGNQISEWVITDGLLDKGEPCLGNLDSDDDLEIVASLDKDSHGQASKTICAWNYDGSNVAGWPIEGPDITYMPVLADVDGDGDTEVVTSFGLHRGDGFGTNNRIYAFHHDGTPVSGWPINFYNWPMRGSMLMLNYMRTSIGDIDNDGKLEMAVSPGYGLLYVTELPASRYPTRLDWPMLAHGPHHTNCTGNAPVLHPISNKTVFAGKLLEFQISANDPDEDKLIYDARGLPEGAILDSSTGEFSWTPSLEQTGRHKITFIASDGFLIDTETVIIYVIGPPRIYFVWPRRAAPGSYVRIFGKDLGPRNYSNRVIFSGHGQNNRIQMDAKIVRWRGKYIVCKVPPVKPGAYKITVFNKAGEGEFKYFIVTPIRRINKFFYGNRFRRKNFVPFLP